MDETWPPEDAGKDTFDFFALPRELRNIIYLSLTQDRIISKNLKVNEARIVSAPLPKLQALSRQFREEYNETFKRGLTIRFKDCAGCDYPPRFEMPPINIVKAEMFLILICREAVCDHQMCRAHEEFLEHIKWINELVPKMNGLKAVAMKIYPCWSPLSSSATDTHQVLSINDQLTELHDSVALSRIEIFPFTIIDHKAEAKGAVTAYQARQIPATTWTKEGGWKK